MRKCRSGWLKDDPLHDMIELHNDTKVRRNFLERSKRHLVKDDSTE